MTKFIEITTKNHLIMHGFDTENHEILEHIEIQEPTKKVVAINRILSLTEKYILIEYTAGRIIYWEYEEDYQAIKSLLEK